jgi:hypothetical protein
MLLSVNTHGALRAFSDLKLGKLNDIKRWLLRSSILGSADILCRAFNAI